MNIAEEIKTAIYNARTAAIHFHEQEERRRLEEAKAAEEKRLQEMRDAMLPSLNRIPNLMIQAGKQGKRYCRLLLPKTDFSNFARKYYFSAHSDTLYANKDSLSHNLRQYLTDIDVRCRFVVDKEESTGAYGEDQTSYSLYLEISF